VTLCDVSIELCVANIFLDFHRETDCVVEGTKKNGMALDDLSREVSAGNLLFFRKNK